MDIPGAKDLIAERKRVVETLDSLTDDEFDNGTTLCDEWAPRDILAHLMGVDYELMAYAKAKGNVKAGNAAIVAKGRTYTRERLMHRARHFAEKPAPLTQLSALFYLGDTYVHHQDIRRGLGMEPREIPDAGKAALLREGVVLGSKRLLSYKLVPTDGGWSMGFGREVHGTCEALGMWMTGRKGIEPELVFGARPAVSERS